jgi:hypothetical protein
MNICGKHDTKGNRRKICDLSNQVNEKLYGNMNNHVQQT